jgi:3',5'-cyclic AMP phosphodiesterase CpdA
VSAPGWLLAHLSDPHVSLPAAPRGRERFGKRALGYASWRRRRRPVHRRDVLDGLAADLAALRPQAIAVTGDFTQVGGPTEFAQAAAWLAELATVAPVLAVPGNHDAYVRGAWEAGRQALVPWLPGAFPWTARVGPACVIGVSSACPTAPFSARGRVGGAQRAALEVALRAAAGHVRIVLIHHPPLPGAVTVRKALADARPLARTIERAGAELVLHGHGHRRASAWLALASGRAFVSGVPSASSTETRPGRGGAYDLYATAGGGPPWTLERAERVWTQGCWDWGHRERLVVGPAGAPAPSG